MLSGTSCSGGGPATVLLRRRQLTTATAKAEGRKAPSVDPSDTDTEELTPEEIEELLGQALEKEAAAAQEEKRRKAQQDSPDLDSSNAYRPTVADTEIRRKASPSDRTLPAGKGTIDAVNLAVQTRSVQDRRIGARSGTDAVRVGQETNPEKTLSRTASIRRSEKGSPGDRGRSRRRSWTTGSS